jgi:integrase/recombinase XerC
MEAKPKKGKWKWGPYKIRWTGTGWQVTLRINGVRYRKSFRGEVDRDPEARKRAEKWATVQRADEFRGLIKAKPKEEAMPFSRLCALFLEDLQLSTQNESGSVGRSPTTFLYYLQRIKGYIAPQLGRHSAQALQPNDIAGYLQWMRKTGYGQGEVNKHIQILKRVFNWAVKRRIVSSNPATTESKEKAPPQREPVIYSWHATQSILGALSGREYGLMLIAFRTGMRRRELLHFDFSWILWDKGLIRVPFNRGYRSKGRSERLIPMDPDVEKWLRSLGRDEGPVFRTVRRQKKGASGGRHRRMTDHRKLLNSIERTTGHHIRLHDARHTFACHLLDSGVDIRVVQSLLGHSSVVITEGYSHLTQKHLEPARQAMEKLAASGTRRPDVAGKPDLRLMNGTSED